MRGFVNMRLALLGFDDDGEDPPAELWAGGCDLNVIDSRQDDPQSKVIAALRALGYEARRGALHAFELCVRRAHGSRRSELGYTLSGEDKERAFIEVSGRKGFGVKADDLIDRMIAAARAEVDARHPELEEEERAEIAKRLAWVRCGTSCCDSRGIR